MLNVRIKASSAGPTGRQSVTLSSAIRCYLPGLPHGPAGRSSLGVAAGGAAVSPELPRHSALIHLADVLALIRGMSF
jgi:hypothetical protein